MPIINDDNFEELKMKGFKSSRNKGFHMTFKNGWTVSVQFGWGNYCENYNNHPKEMRDFGKVAYASDTAEVWSWNREKHYPKEPLGYQTPEEVIKFMNKISKRKKVGEKK